MNRNIGGPLDYRVMAELNKPKDAEGIRKAALELVRNGLSDHGVAMALRLDVNAVRKMIGHCESCE